VKPILVVEDEFAISLVLKAYLEKARYTVVQAFTYEEALDKWQKHMPALVLLDVMLPDGSGWDLLKLIRGRSACPVIMLTALGDLHSKLDGLNQGADDYILKPFVVEEVLARVNTVLRRSSHLFEQDSALFLGSLKIDFKAHQVYLHGIPLKLAPKDLALFLYLAEHPNQTLTREQLIERIWGFDYEGSDRAVDLAIKRIRQALKDWPSEEGDILTLRGVGYQIRVQT
jgi:DNA-binding response OmpR family regulator